MDKALKDKQFSFMYRCPQCGELATRMNTTHPWRLYCTKCKKELQNPDHPEYYPQATSGLNANLIVKE